MKPVYIFIQFIYLMIFLKSTTGNQGTCEDIRCEKGKMCIEDSNSTSCVCPTACLDEFDPVCTHYLIEFDNFCSLHKFACHHRISIGVAYKGICNVEVSRLKTSKRLDICPKKSILQFKERYLEWLWVMKKVQEGKKVKELKPGVRAKSSSRQQRLQLSKWDFARWDTNNDGLWFAQEFEKLIDALIYIEPCIYGFVMSCNSDDNVGITKYEWDSCLE